MKSILKILEEFYEGSFTADSGNVNIGISITKEMNQKLAWEDVTNSNSLTGTSGAKTLKDKNGNTWTKQ